MTRFAMLPMVLAACLISAGVALAEGPTPIDAALPAGEISLIASPIPGSETVENRSVPLMHYRLYLPADYHQTGSQTYPAMFIAAPGGNAKMGEMRDALVRDRWIVAMLVESRNGSQIWRPNFMAAYDDLIQRVRVQREMLFCTGLSGAAKVCSVYPAIRRGFRGMILQAAGPWSGRVFAEPGNDDLLVYGTFGTFDGNFHHARRIRISVPDGVRRLVEIWDGEHAWAPRDVFERGLDWIVRAALLDSAYDPGLGDTYRWYAENRLSEFGNATSAIERHAALKSIKGLPAAWRDATNQDLIERIDAAFATTAAPADDELAAYDAFQEAMRDDENDNGHNPETIAALYQAIAEQYPETTYGAKAATRRQAVQWETGQYP